jgi:hypothetical protein
MMDWYTVESNDLALTRCDSGRGLTTCSATRAVGKTLFPQKTAKAMAEAFTMAQPGELFEAKRYCTVFCAYCDEHLATTKDADGDPACKHCAPTTR